MIIMIWNDINVQLYLSGCIKKSPKIRAWAGGGRT